MVNCKLITKYFLIPLIGVFTDVACCVPNKTKTNIAFYNAHSGTKSVNLPIIIDTCCVGIGTKPPVLLQVIKQ